jgi:hypothetical protein
LVPGEPRNDENVPALSTKDRLQNNTASPKNFLNTASFFKQSTFALDEFVPRKRTNTDHVITPKKHKRQRTLYQQVQPLAERVNGASSPAKRPRKSIRKSILMGSMEESQGQKDADLNARRLSQVGFSIDAHNIVPSSQSPVVEVTKVAKSRRKSRRSTIGVRQSGAHVEKQNEVTNTELKAPEWDPAEKSATHTMERPDVPECEDQVTTIASQAASSETATLEKPLDFTLEAPTGGLDPSEHTKAVDETSSPRTTLDGKICSGATSEINFDLHISTTLSETAHDLVESQITINTDAAMAPLDEEVSESPRGVAAASSVDDVALQEKLPADEATQIPEETTSTLNASKPTISDIPTYDHDDTDMLLNFLTRVKANKAAKNPPRRKRSLPHSPLRIPLGDLDNNSPSPLRLAGESGITEPSPSKRKKKSPLSQDEDSSETRSIRRSGRTRIPVKEPPGVPSFIPVRRLGQDPDTTVTLKRSEEKELAALTRVNTRKNKGNALSALELLAKKSEEKEDPVMRQRLLKEVFDERTEKSKQDKKGKDKKVVTWAEEIAQYQILTKTLTKGKLEIAKDEKQKETGTAVQGAEDKKAGTVRVGVRSKSALGAALNGTPMPKRKMRGRT